ncbi:3-dehydroquinate synthase [Flavobacteriaceae bacterium]|nr:3-dehydroquinate synthase [Flavobacteriaceae bacterium]
MQNQINISYGSEGLTALVQQLNKHEYSSLFILVDENTKQHCLTRFLAHTELNPTSVLVMQAGEENKHLSTCEKLWNELSSLGADRNSALINLGGGVVNDLGGFVACTFKRGIDFYNIPTTLLSMVDASVGGKTGIDLGALKNQIGIIQEPQQVVIDSQWLSTLPLEEVRSGFAEMLKHGLIADANYWGELKDLVDLTPEVLSPYIKPSVAVKSEVVQEDPYEKGLRKILNFGHTLGHAIESYFLVTPSKQRLLHGEAIAIGMVLEAYLSIECCGLSPEEAKEIKLVFQQFYPQVEIKEEDVEAILALLRHDKKNKAGRINFVLLTKIGIPAIDVQVPQELFQKAFDFYASA